MTSNQQEGGYLLRIVSGLYSPAPPHEPNPTGPEPNRRRVAGSGMGLAPRFVNVVLVMGVKEPDRSNGCLEMSHLLFSWEA